MVMHTGQVFRRMLERVHLSIGAHYLVAYLVGYLVAARGGQQFCRSQAADYHRELCGKAITLASIRINMPS